MKITFGSTLDRLTLSPRFTVSANGLVVGECRFTLGQWQLTLRSLIGAAVIDLETVVEEHAKECCTEQIEGLMTLFRTVTAMGIR